MQTKSELRAMLAEALSRAADAGIQPIRFQTFSRIRQTKADRDAKAAEPVRVVPTFKKVGPRRSTPMTVQLPPIRTAQRFGIATHDTPVPHELRFTPEAEPPVMAPTPEPAFTCVKGPTVPEGSVRQPIADDAWETVLRTRHRYSRKGLGHAGLPAFAGIACDPVYAALQADRPAAKITLPQPAWATH